MSESTDRPGGDVPVLFAEPGASLFWLLAGPAGGGVLAYMQISSGVGFQWSLPVVFGGVLTIFTTIVVLGARYHTTVELTPHTLRQGAQRLPTSEIVGIFPEFSDDDDGGPRQAWVNPVTARALRKAGVDPSEVNDTTPADPDADVHWRDAPALGELTGVPRGRKGIGLRLADERIRQAWARNQHGLRAALVALLNDREPPRAPGPADG